MNPNASKDIVIVIIGLGMSDTDLSVTNTAISLHATIVHALGAL